MQCDRLLVIDGKRQVSPHEFESQKNFVIFFTSVIGEDSAPEIAVFQNVFSNSAAIPLTANMEKIIRGVKKMEQKGEISFEVSGMNYCFSQLWRRNGETNKILHWIDGSKSIDKSLVKRANLFKRFGGELTFVVVGPHNKTGAEETAMNAANINNASSFDDVVDPQGLAKKLIYNICNLFLCQ